MKNLFERKEMKYRLTKDQAKSFESILASWLVPDAYPEYDICSVYFDSKDWNLFRKSLDKPEYKEKLRLRSYGTPDENDPVFLEIKKKFQGVVYKRRIDLTLHEAKEFLDKQPEGHTVSEKEISWLLKKEDLEPKIYVSYHRKAWTWVDDPELRITLDNKVRWRAEDLDLKDGMEGEDLFDDDENAYILEIKSTTNFPIVLVRTLNALGIRPASVSKAGLAYSRLLERGVIHGLS